jgi:sorbitol-specific phosphotransferase system component IIBC
VVETKEGGQGRPPSPKCLKKKKNLQISGKKKKNYIKKKKKFMEKPTVKENFIKKKKKKTIATTSIKCSGRGTEQFCEKTKKLHLSLHLGKF